MTGWTSPGGDPQPSGGPQQPVPAPPPGSPPPSSPPPPPPPGSPLQPQGPWGELPGYPHVPAAARPGIVPLRPLGLGEIYDGAFQAVRSNPAAMVGAAAVVVTVMTAVQLALQAWMTGSLGTLLQATEEAADGGELPDSAVLVDALGTSSLAALLTQVVSLVALAVLTAIAIVVVGSAVLGRRTGGSDLWQRVRGRLLPLIGVTLLVGLITVGLVVAAFVPGLLAFLVSDVLAVVLLLLGLAAALGLGLWIDTRLALAGPALVLEEQRVVASIRRSWRLTSRGFWRVLGIRLLTLVIVFVTTAIVSAPFQIVGMLFGSDSSDPFAAFALTLPQLLLTGVGQAIASTIVYPFAAAVTALLYVDQRMRLEGLDVELSRAAAETA
jgi:hypothetical protein